MSKSPTAIAQYERVKAERRANQLRAVELRKSGHSFREIGRMEGCTAKTAQARYQAGIAQYIPPELIEEARRTELDRFDQITVLNFTLLVKAYNAGDIDTFCKIQDRINAVHDRRKKMVPIEIPVTMTIENNTTVRTAQDTELQDLLSRATQSVEDQISFLRSESEPVRPDEDLNHFR